MTCRRLLGALGDTEPWERWYADPKDVYLFRAPVIGAELNTAEDALLVLKAVAKAQELSLDVRGITVYACGPGGAQCVDVVMTSDSHLPYAVPQLPRRLAEAAAADGELRQRFPTFSFGSCAETAGCPAVFLTLTGPAAAADFWRAAPVVWDDVVGPTDAYAKAEGVFTGGAADHAPKLKAWKPGAPRDHEDEVPQTALGPVGAIGWAALAALTVWLGASYFGKGSA